jgi:chromosome segregation ATPase
MSSIAVVRALVKQDSSSHDALEDELSAVKQTRYEDRLRFEEQLQTQADLVQDLQAKLKEAQEEARRENSIRQTLEKTNEALDEHKKLLSTQLESVSQSRGSLEGTVQGVRSTLEEEKAAAVKAKVQLESMLQDAIQQKDDAMEKSGEWETRFLASQRQTNELTSQLESLKKQVEHSTVRHQDVLQGHNNTYETFKKRLEESAAARKRAEEELKLIGAGQGTDVSASSQKSSPPDYDTQVKMLKAQEQKLQAQMNENLSKHRDVLQGHVRFKEDMKRRLEEAEDAQAKAEEKVRTHSWKPSCSVAVLRIS